MNISIHLSHLGVWWKVDMVWWGWIVGDSGLGSEMFFKIGLHSRFLLPQTNRLMGVTRESKNYSMEIFGVFSEIPSQSQRRRVASSLK